jgi:hypothetical protein
MQGDPAEAVVQVGGRDGGQQQAPVRRFVTATDSVAAPRSKAEPETLRAITQTVLFD